MQKHSDDKIRKLKECRRNGWSINELVERFSIPKTTVWHHVQKVEVSPVLKKVLRSRQGGSAKRKQNDIQKAAKEAKKRISGSHKYRHAVLGMLYWAEGNKNRLVFTNTDPIMIKTYIATLGECFGVTKDRLLVTVRYFTGMDRQKCLGHWADITNIPKDKINMYYNDGGVRGKSPYGICRISVKKGGYLLKVIQSLIQEVSADVMPL